MESLPELTSVRIQTDPLNEFSFRTDEVAQKSIPYPTDPKDSPSSSINAKSVSIFPNGRTVQRNILPQRHFYVSFDVDVYFTSHVGHHLSALSASPNRKKSYRFLRMNHFTNVKGDERRTYYADIQ